VGYVITAVGGWGKEVVYLFRYSRAFSVDVLKEFHEDIESTVEAYVLSGEFSVP